MKFTKLSLVAALAVSAAFAGGDIEPVAAPVVETSPWTFGGDVKLFYSSTNDSDADISLFDQASAMGQAAVGLDVSYAFADTWKINAGLTGLATLGLDDSVVSGVWLYAGSDATNGGLPFTSIGDALWFDTLNITGTAFDGKATFILGRTELDTPLAFTETWSIANNTFDAAVAMVKPMDELTLVAGYIYDGNGNGRRISTFSGQAGGFTGDAGYFPIADIEQGAWTVAAIGTIGDVTAQAWYYDVMDVAQAVWAQADADFSGFTIGGQYAWITADDVLKTNLGPVGTPADIKDSSAFAGKIGYKMDAFEAWAAYSSVDDDGVIPVANTATMVGSIGWGNQSKLYTEAWWNYGFVGQAGADSFGAAASYNVGDLAMFNGISLLGQYTNVSDAKLWGDAELTADMQEFTALIGATAYGLNVQLAYIYADYTFTDAVNTPNVSESHNNDTVQAYLTYTF